MAGGFPCKNWILELRLVHFSLQPQNSGNFNIGDEETIKRI